MPDYTLHKKYGIPISKYEQTDEQKELLKKLQREKNLERQRRYRQTESYRKAIRKHRSTERHKENQRIYAKNNPRKYKPLTDPNKIKKRYLRIKKYKQSEKGKLVEKKYYEKNIKKIQKYQQDYKESGKLAAFEKRWRLPYLKNKRLTNPTYRLITNLRARLKSYLSGKNLKKHISSLQLIGCTPEELKAHIEKQFKPGMTWENYGQKTWHIDHIKPLSLAKSMQDVIDQKLMHYTNLQPLWAKENISKSNKLNTN